MEKTTIKAVLERLSLSINDSSGQISAGEFINIWKQAIETSEIIDVAKLAEDHRHLLSDVDKKLEDSRLYSILDINKSKGGFGEVSFVRHKELNRTYAQKEVADKNLFKKEVQILSELKHPNIVVLYDTAKKYNGGIVTYVLRLEVLGMSLSDLVNKHGAKVTVRKLVDIMCDTLRGMSYMHGLGIIHGDFKPDNCHVEDEAGNAHTKIIDFGCSARIHETLDTHSEQFSCPELRRFEKPKAHPHIDTYSVGATLRECLLLLRLPVPSGLRNIIAKAVSEEPSERYLTAAHMLKDYDLETEYIQKEFARPTWMPTTHVIDKYYEGYRQNIIARWFRTIEDSGKDLLSHEYGDHFCSAYQSKIPVVKQMIEEGKTKSSP